MQNSYKGLRLYSQTLSWSAQNDEKCPDFTYSAVMVDLCNPSWLTHTCTCRPRPTHRQLLTSYTTSSASLDNKLSCCWGGRALLLCHFLIVNNSDMSYLIRLPPVPLVTLLFMITTFGTSRKPVCYFLLVNNSNLHFISHWLQDITAYWSNFQCRQGRGLS